jgi:NADH dehydrogenase
VLHWAVSFVGRGRQERTATEQQIFGRQALSRLDHGAQDLVSPPAPEQTAEAQEARRAELEAIALEEARLTDAGERGVPQEADAR